MNGANGDRETFNLVHHGCMRVVLVIMEVMVEIGWFGSMAGIFSWTRLVKTSHDDFT